MFSASTTGSYSKTKNKSESSGETFDKMTPAQQKYYMDFLENQEQFFNDGGAQKDTAAYDAAKDTLAGTTSALDEFISGERDASSLHAMHGIQRDAAADNLGQLTHQIGASANQAGGAGGSRSGIAQGLAAAEADKNLQAQQAQTTYEWNQQGEQNRLAAIDKAQQASQQYMGLADAATTASQQKLDNLLAQKQLISGDMGGTTEGTHSDRSRSESTTAGVSASSSFGLSDEKLKKNMKKTGNKVGVKGSQAVIDEYEYLFTEEAKDDFDAPSGTQKGVKAQDLEKVKPSAVKEVVAKTDSKSKKKKKKKAKSVDYSQLAKASSKLDNAFKSIG